MSRKKNRRWNSTRLRGPIDAAVQARFEAAFEQQLNEEMKRQIAIAVAQGGNMHGTRLTIKTPKDDIVLEFPEKAEE